MTASLVKGTDKNMQEFTAIAQFFTHPTLRSDTLLGVGDDGALCQADSQQMLVISTDLLVVHQHFFPDADPYLLGQKALAVNLSDMAAMGASPAWVTLGIALPHIDSEWLSAFSQGFGRCAKKYQVDWVGGDTTRGELTLAVQIIGQVPQGEALRRDAAQIGDDIWVSGCLGEAALGLQVLLNKIALDDPEHTRCLQRLHTPTPRLALGMALRNIAHACIDISDGLLADLQHICDASSCGARLEWDAIPKPNIPYIALNALQTAVLAGGEDYELCFTAPYAAREKLIQLSQTLDLPLSRIGHTHAGQNITLLDTKQRPFNIKETGYDHFRTR